MFRKTFLVCALGAGWTTTCHAQDMTLAATTFDTETIKSLGIDPSVAKFFARKAVYLPGEYSLALQLNGKDVGSVIAHFEQDGVLCVDRKFMEQAQLRIPDDYRQGCYDYAQAFPGTEIISFPAQEKLSIVVPPQAITPKSLEVGDYSSGGTAALINYSLMSSHAEFDSNSSDYSQAMLDGGFNINDWLFRTRQFLSVSEGKFSNENSSTYLQHTFTSIATQMLVGEVNLNNTLLDGASIYGFEFSPETALQAQGSGVEVKGIANTAQARVEIRQQGILVYSTLVPAGAFTLPNVPVRSATSDLNVTVIETDGNQQTFTVPASLFSQQVASPQGYHIAFGRVDDNYTESPWVLSASGGWSLTPWNNVNSGIVVSEQYQAIAASSDLMPLPELTLSGQINLAKDNRDDLNGLKQRLSVGYQLPLALGLTASYSHLDRDYRDLSDTLDDEFNDPTKNEYAVGLSWSQPMIGGLSLSWYQTENYDSQNDSQSISLSWNRSIQRTTLSVNWQHQIHSGDENNDDDRIFVNLSIPFGRSQAVNIYTRRDSHNTWYGTSANGALTDETSYSLSAERDHDEAENSFNGSVNTNLHYTQLGLSASANGPDNRSYSGTLTGGIAAHSQGVTFSPLPISDTFALAKVENNVSGVKLNTPQGAVWTDFRGNAVIPSLQAWQTANIEIDNSSLPKNVDVGNGIRTLKQGRGAVGKVNFSTLTQRRALLNITLPDGRKLPRGLAIEDDQGNYVTTSVDDGVVFVNNINEEITLVAKVNERACKIHLTFPEKAPEDIFYETASGVCQ